MGHKTVLGPVELEEECSGGSQWDSELETWVWGDVGLERVVASTEGELFPESEAVDSEQSMELWDQGH